MSPRVAPILAASLALVIVAACGASVPPPSAVPVTAVPVPVEPTRVPSPGSLASIPPVVTTAPGASAPPAGTAPSGAGNVDGTGTGPELTIEMVRGDTIRATLDDPSAKAWRLVVAGAGKQARDRWEILVETGDVAPVITATEVRDGHTVDVMDLSGFADGTAAAGGCHRTLPVCLSSDGFRLPQDGDGRFSVQLVLPEPGTPLSITGGTAAWPGEPFVLGPWTDTEPFPWNGAN